MTAIDSGLDDVAARALTSMILECTADALEGDGRNAEVALRRLADDSGLDVMICAGILQATSWLAATGGVLPVAVNAGALTFGPDEADEPPAVPYGHPDDEPDDDDDDDDGA